MNILRRTSVYTLITEAGEPNAALDKMIDRLYTHPSTELVASFHSKGMVTLRFRTDSNDILATDIATDLLEVLEDAPPAELFTGVGVHLRRVAHQHGW
jgi:hypothetical protein